MVSIAVDLLRLFFKIIFYFRISAQAICFINYIKNLLTFIKLSYFYLTKSVQFDWFKKVNVELISNYFLFRLCDRRPDAFVAIPCRRRHILYVYNKMLLVFSITQFIFILNNPYIANDLSIFLIINNFVTRSS